MLKIRLCILNPLLYIMIDSLKRTRRINGKYIWSIKLIKKIPQFQKALSGLKDLDSISC